MLYLLSGLSVVYVVLCCVSSGCCVSVVSVVSVLCGCCVWVLELCVVVGLVIIMLFFPSTKTKQHTCSGERVFDFSQIKHVEE
jgi:hypothetical protein